MESREFRYRPHIKWFQYAIVVFVGLTSVLPALAMAVGTGLEGEMHVPSLVTALVMGILTLVMFWVFRTMASTRVTVDDDGVRYRSYRKDFRVGFDEIEQLKFPSLTYLGGWLKIKSDQPDIRLTVVLEDLHELVEPLKRGLENAKNTAAYDRGKFFAFYKTAGFASHSWDRVYKLFAPILALTIAALVAWNVFSPAVFDTPDLTAIYWIGATALFPMLGWIVAEIIMLISFVRDADEERFSLPERDPAGERKMMAMGYGAYVVLSVAVYFAVTAILV